MELNPIQQQRLERLNKGINFDNFNKKKPLRYFIEVGLETKQTLQEKEEKIVVNHNLPLGYGYWGNSYEKFIENLKSFVSSYYGQIIKNNKKTELGYSDLRPINKVLRKETLNFEEIDIEVGELAEKKLKEKGIDDFSQEIRTILSLQKDNNIQREVDSYVRLKEKIAVLKNLLGKRTSSSYYYGRESDKDETIKIRLSDDEYNEKMQDIEKELRAVEKELGLEESEIEYLKEEETEEDEEEIFDEEEYEEDEEE